MNNVAGAIIVFACVSIIGLGYFLIIPSTYSRIQANVTDAQTNETLIKAVGLTNLVTSTWGWIPIAVGAFVVLSVFVYLFWRRGG
jgi:hypothetical protein